MSSTRLPKRGPITSLAIEYAEALASGSIASNEQVKHTAQQYLERMRTWKYDEAEVERYGKFIQMLPYPEGDWDTPNIVLTDWQCLFLSGTLGFMDPEFPDMKAVNVASIAVPRKAGKSTLCAVIALAHICLSRQTEPTVVCAGPKTYQAEFVVRKAVSICRRNQNLTKRFDLRVSDVKITRMSGNGGSMFAVSSNVRTQDGQNPSMVIVDETHAIQDPELIAIHKTAFGARKNPLMIMATTASSDMGGVGYSERNKHFAAAREGVSNPSEFALCYEADIEDDPAMRDTWLKAQPSLGSVIPEKNYRDAYQQAVQSPDTFSTFQSRLLNIWGTGTLDTYVEVSDFDATPSPAKTLDQLSRTDGKCWIGVDLAQELDLTSICVVMKSRQGVISAHWRNFVSQRLLNMLNDTGPRAAIGELRNADQWIKEGWLRASNNGHGGINFDDVAEELDDLVGRLRVEYIVLDQFVPSWELQDRLTSRCERKLGRTRKTAMTYTVPCREVRSRIQSKSLVLEKNPVARYCLDNARVERRLDGSMIIKKKSPASMLKIDAADAMILGMIPAFGGALRPTEMEERAQLDPATFRIMRV